MDTIDTILERQRSVPFKSLFLDPNNPRIAAAEPPGYDDLEALFDPELQEKLEQEVAKKYDTASLENAIIGQGWVPMDGMVVWAHPSDPKRYVVVEGNRRTTALRRLRARLPAEQKKLKAMEARSKNSAQSDLDEQKKLVARLEHIIADTEKIIVSPARADDPTQLDNVLPRIMGVRHLTGAKEWTENARGLYVLKRYERLFATKFPKKKLQLDDELVAQVGVEVSLGETVTRRAIQAAAAFSHFQREYSDKLPEGEEFVDSDYYAFALLVRNPFLRDKFNVSPQSLQLNKEGEAALFEWVFSKERPDKAADNDNIFYRHENLDVWARMKRYDDEHGTAFAMRFDVSQPETAPQFRLVEGAWRTHQARQSPIDVIQKLIQELEKLTANTLIDSAAHLKPLFKKLSKLTQKLDSMTDIEDDDEQEEI